ncbi:uncharacterized protein BT62DRAFT_376865 [Guyanagaster necrorhizus]|uniref:F-box domain-containing protein n=1 Tax=Guyanagaster necrorhizus TaxID=856835 RepID=A0A9P7VLB9_9AGAR|nr:uncharacterized protein BT62DRAFT_376865 [Guyanagaster necrorhizus MCA 3950]KAG7442587.1 hypothetical protein BT62DRAFT_376865 [Guyanagaster necrorhizus MCA 3950]
MNSLLHDSSVPPLPPAFLSSSLMHPVDAELIMTAARALHSASASIRDSHHSKPRRMLRDAFKALPSPKHAAPIPGTHFGDIAPCPTDVLSPIQRLPTEILTDIFLHLHHDRPQLPFVHKVAEAPRLLTYVCRRWRDIVDALPSLWSSFSVNLDANHASRVTALSVFLRNSRGTLLTFDCIMHDISDYGERILQLLFHEKHRWESVRILGKGQNLSRFAPIGGRLPMLRYLKLIVIGQPDRFVCGAYELAPRLDNVFIQGVRPVAHSLRLPWAQLTSYFAEEDRLEDHLSVLRRTPKVQHCHLRVRHPSSAGDTMMGAPIKRLEMRCLSKLVVNNANILDHLVLPALEDITIHQSPQSIPTESLAALLCHSGCSLRALSLRLFPSTFSSAGLLPVFRFPAAQTVVTLDLLLLVYPFDLIAGLAGGEHGLLPKLQELVVKIPSYPFHAPRKFDKGCLEVVARLMRRSALRRVYLEVYVAREVEIPKAMAPWVTQKQRTVVVKWEARR